jgi:hypothetical protein
MNRLAGILVLTCAILAVQARAQVSPEEAYRRLRERQAQEQHAPEMKPKPSGSDKSAAGDDASTGIMPRQTVAVRRK